jgi:hypothetical protein
MGRQTCCSLRVDHPGACCSTQCWVLFYYIACIKQASRAPAQHFLACRSTLGPVVHLVACVRHSFACCSTLWHVFSTQPPVAKAETFFNTQSLIGTPPSLLQHSEFFFCRPRAQPATAPCSLLQHLKSCCQTLQIAAAPCDLLQRPTSCCSTLFLYNLSSTFCRLLQHLIACWSTLKRAEETPMACCSTM